MINAQVSTALVAVTTLATILYVALGFFRHPSKASAIWATAFGVMMMGSYGWVSSADNFSGPVRAASSAAMLAACALVWSGLRAHRGARHSYALFATLYGAVAAAALALSAETDAFGWVFRAAYAVATLFSGAMIYELLRRSGGRRDEVLALAVPSAVFVLFGLLSFVDGIVRLTLDMPADSDSLQLVRELNALGAFVYVTCSLVVLLLLTRGRPQVSTAFGATGFREIAADRLLRAERTNDSWWALLEIRLDEPLDQREASSKELFSFMTQRFSEEARAALPAGADVDKLDETTIMALVPGSRDVVRQSVSQLLRKLAYDDPGDRTPALRVSASVGWADVDMCGYDLELMMSTAREAVLTAQSRGGDQWVRPTVKTTADGSTSHGHGEGAERAEHSE